MVKILYLDELNNYLEYFETIFTDRGFENITRKLVKMNEKVNIVHNFKSKTET